MAETGAGLQRKSAVRVLHRRVDALVAGGAVSGPRARQLRMVVGMWERALEQWPQGTPVPGTASGDLFADDVLQAFWDLAAGGRLWARESDVGRAPSQGTLRVVRDCLGILADQVLGEDAGATVWLPSVAQPEPKQVVPAGQLPVLYRKLVDMASDAPVERAGVALSYEDRVRLLAIVAVVLDTGARSAELEAMRLEDLGEGESSVWVHRRPQNALHLPPVDEHYVLRDGTGVTVRRWLRVRKQLVGGLEGGDPRALWVSLRANQWQPKPGFPLRAQGIRMAFTRGAVALNGVMAGQYGWEPLPTTLEQLRRTVDVEPRRDAAPVA